MLGLETALSIVLSIQGDRAGLGRHRRADVPRAGPHRRAGRPRPRPGARRAGQPDAGRPGRPLDGRPGRAGQPQPQHPVRGHDAARPGRRDVPARRADRARREGGREATGRRSWSSRTGATFHGEAYGSVGETFGEAVFTTGDDRLPGDADRPVVPPAGRRADRAAHRQHRRQRRGRRVGPDLGRRVRGARPGPDAVELARPPAAWRTGWPPRAIVGISGIDTRALTRHLRERGAMRVGVSSVETDPAALLRAGARRTPQMARRRPVRRGDHAERVHGRRPRASTASRSPRSTSASSATCRGGWPRAASPRTCCPRRPRSTTCSPSSADAVFFSPGPGDPATADHAVALAREVLRRRIPLFGICFGSQILGRALGFGTYKLRYGHRGINQPVLDRATGKVEVTSHNHGFAVDAPLRRVGRHRLRRGRGQPRLPQRQRGRGAALPATCRRSRCSTTRRRRPGRTTPTTCSTGSWS